MSKYRSFLFCSIAMLICFGSVFAADPVLEKTTAAPAGLPGPLAQLLNSDGFRVTVDGKVLGEFWVRKELPAAPSASSELGVNFGTIAPSAFVGVVNLPTDWADYKGQKIPAGLYSMRYAILPADGAHMGVAAHRDFLLLIPVASDADPNATYAKEELYKLSVKSSGTNHPAVLSLFPVQEQVNEAKLMQNDVGQWTVAVPVGGTNIGVVVLGHGEGV